MLKGKKAIVTGASRGIGFAIAKAIVENGATVVITGRNAETLEKAAGDIGDNCIPLVWDAFNVRECGEKFAQAVEMLGGLDVFVNNAGISGARSEKIADDLLQTTPDEWEKVLTVNTSALFFGMQQAVKYFKENGIKGNVLNVTSVAGDEPVCGAYRTSKVAATALTRGWGMMFAPYGITINGIAPGPVATQMYRWHEGDPLENSKIPYGRLATGEELAKLALYLLSDDARMICGETVIFDGGYAIR